MFLARVLSIGKGSAVTPRHRHRHRQHPPHQLHPHHLPQLHLQHLPQRPPPHHHRLPGERLTASQELLPWPDSPHKDPVKKYNVR